MDRFPPSKTRAMKFQSFSIIVPTKAELVPSPLTKRVPSGWIDVNKLLRKLDSLCEKEVIDIRNKLFKILELN